MPLYVRRSRPWPRPPRITSQAPMRRRRKRAPSKKFSAHPPVTYGRCYWPDCTSPRHWYVQTARPTCVSPPSSRTAIRCATFWSTSARMPNSRGSHPHEDHRPGREKSNRCRCTIRLLSLSQISSSIRLGIGDPSPAPLTHSSLNRCACFSCVQQAFEQPPLGFLRRH